MRSLHALATKLLEFVHEANFPIDSRAKRMLAAASFSLTTNFNSAFGSPIDTRKKVR